MPPPRVTRETEAVIRSALGEAAFAGEVHPGRFSYAEIGIAVLGRLLEDQRLSRGEVEELFGRVDEMRRAEHDLFPVLGVLQDAWFRVGMHASPFAVSDGHDEREGR